MLWSGDTAQADGVKLGVPFVVPHAQAFIALDQTRTQTHARDAIVLGRRHECRLVSGHFIGRELAHDM